MTRQSTGLDYSSAALRPLRQRQCLTKKLDSVAHLTQGRDDDKLSAVLPLLSRTVGSMRLSRGDAQMVFNADDCGTSCMFELASEQLESLQHGLLAEGARAEVLSPWHVH